MRALPEEFDAGELIGALADGWGFDAEAAEYEAVGGGSYHWLANDREGTRRFVTVDDLDGTPWLGETRASVFEGLRRAFDTAAALRAGGLDFVVAPIPTSRGETVRRIGLRYTVALFPFVAGDAGRFGDYEPADRAAAVAMLAELHRATPAVASGAGSVGLELYGRRHLEAGLRELEKPWLGGPFSEPARHALAGHASDVADLLALADRLAAAVTQRGRPWVVTHGEPHAANVLRTDEGHVLVDWDTVALAPPERDLWMVESDNADELAGYVDATGHQLDPAALDFFRLTWDLKDLAAFINALRSPHRESADTVKAYEGLKTCVAIRDRWEALL